MFGTIEFLEEFLDEEVLDETTRLTRAQRPHFAKMGKKGRARFLLMPDQELAEVATTEPNQSASSVLKPQRTLCKRLHQAIRSLEEDERKAINWVYFSGLTRAETARAMKVSSSTLRRLLNSAREKIKTALEGSGLRFDRQFS